MEGLQLKFLGELEVLRNGERLELPASRKTRALLAYLALNRRPFRREQLCELFWDIPDDPRGSLRWSLSKLRRLVDDETQARIRADRIAVAFDPAGAVIDIDELKAMSAEELDHRPLETLEAAAQRYLGIPLEGLDLPDFHDFSAWRTAECDAVRRSQAHLLSTLIRRLADVPERALPHARALANIDPYDESAHAALTRLERALRTPRARSTPSETNIAESPPAHDRPIGRDAEIQLIAATFRRAIEQRRCGLVMISGEPGMGKSRLLETAAAPELARAEVAGDSARSLGDLVQERLARFDKEGGEVLRWAAVLAPRIDADTLARVTGLDWNRIGETLQTAARQAMLRQVDGHCRFSHDLIARGIYDAIAPAQRSSMHRRIAELLEQDSALDPQRAADLAHHASQSGDAGLAARAMICAGRLCLRFFANQQALALARKGLQWVARLPSAERVCPTIELHEIMMTAAPVEDWQTAAREYAALAEMALDQGAISHARRGYYMAAYMHWLHGQWDGARAEILQSERVARGGDDEEHIIGMAEAARCLGMLERDLPHADAMLMEVQALAARKRLRHCVITAALGLLRFHENRLDEAVEHFKEARILARSSGDRLNEFQANEYLAMIDIERDRPDAARITCASLIELGEKLREGSERCFAHALDALCHYTICDDAAPLAVALAELRTADAKYRLAYTLNRAALVDLGRQRPQAAIDRAGEALGHALALERISEVMIAHVVLARAHRAANDEHACARHLLALDDLEDTPVAGYIRTRTAALRATLD